MMALKLETLRGGGGVVRNPRGSKKLGNIPTPLHDRKQAFMVGSKPKVLSLGDMEPTIAADPTFFGPIDAHIQKHVGFDDDNNRGFKQPRYEKKKDREKDASVLGADGIRRLTMPDGSVIELGSGKRAKSWKSTPVWLAVTPGFSEAKNNEGRRPPKERGGPLPNRERDRSGDGRSVKKKSKCDQQEDNQDFDAGSDSDEHDEAQSEASDTVDSQILKQPLTPSQKTKSKAPTSYYHSIVAKKNEQHRNQGSYFYVTEYDEGRGKVRLVNLEPHGYFTGRVRGGRVKWRAVMNDGSQAKCLRSFPKSHKKGASSLSGPSSSHNLKFSASGITTLVNARDWDVVPGEEVLECRDVGGEVWDVRDHDEEV